jgi:hypothetical protein
MATGCAGGSLSPGLTAPHSIRYIGQPELNWNSSEEQGCKIDTTLDAG